LDPNCVYMSRLDQRRHDIKLRNIHNLFRCRPSFKPLPFPRSVCNARKISPNKLLAKSLIKNIFKIFSVV
jgi:hypothetical protein